MQLPPAAANMPEVFTPEMVAILDAGIDGYINEVAPFLKRQPMTLSHNDFHAGKCACLFVNIYKISLKAAYDVIKIYILVTMLLFIVYYTNVDPPDTQPAGLP